MKRISMALLAAGFLASYADAQEPEFIRNDLTVSNAYKTSASSDSIYYFVGHDGNYDLELWRTNGTPEGTYLLSNLYQGGPANPFEFTMVGDQLYFMTTDDSRSDQLYKSDGS